MKIRHSVTLFVEDVAIYLGFPGNAELTVYDESEGQTVTAKEITLVWDEESK